MLQEKRSQIYAGIELAWPLAGAVLIHLIFFGCLTFRINAMPFNSRTEIAFLGAILDSFEVKKITNATVADPGLSAILSKKDRNTRRAVTAPDKPNLTGRVNLDPKIFFKSLPTSRAMDDKNIPIVTGGAPKKDPETKPYQPLRLY